MLISYTLLGAADHELRTIRADQPDTGSLSSVSGQNSLLLFPSGTLMSFASLSDDAASRPWQFLGVREGLDGISLAQKTGSLGGCIFIRTAVAPRKVQRKAHEGKMAYKILINMLKAKPASASLCISVRKHISYKLTSLSTAMLKAL